MFKQGFVVAAVAGSLLLSGCVLIKSQSSTQLGEIGAVQLVTTVCASDVNSNNGGYNPPDPACQGPSRGGNSGGDAANRTIQLKVAYRIPASATAPDAITTADPGGAGAIAFGKSSSYTSQLQSLSPAPSGQQWVGYLSAPVSYTVAGNQYFTVAPQFSLGSGPDGSPFQGPFDYRTVVGFRTVNESQPGSTSSRPVTCGGSIAQGYFDGAGGSQPGICADSPTPAAISTNLQQPTQDLRILEDSDAASADQGKVARVNFDAFYAGDGAPAPTFAVTAATNVPGAEAAPSTPVLTPAEGTNYLRTILRVPIDTPPGSYDVTLIASLDNGQVRSSTRQLLVGPTTVRCGGLAPTIAGTRKNDRLKGTRGRDVIAGYLGNDRITGLRGNDRICAGRGNDTVRGGNGNDRIQGRRGNDRLTGGRGRNRIRPGPGRDRFIQ